MYTAEVPEVTGVTLVLQVRVSPLSRSAVYYYRILNWHDYVTVHSEVIENIVKNRKIRYTFHLSQNCKNNKKIVLI